MSAHQTIIIENPSGEPSIGIDENLIPKPCDDDGPNVIELYDILLEQKSRTIRVVCLTDMALNLVIAFYDPFYLVFFFTMSCIGYIGARDFNLLYVYMYTLYQFFAMCGKMYLVVNTFGKIANSLYALLCIVEIMQIIFFIYNLKFSRLMIRGENNVLE